MMATTARRRLTESERLAALEKRLSEIKAKYNPPDDVAGLLAWSAIIDSPDTITTVCVTCGAEFDTSIVTQGRKAGRPMYSNCPHCRTDPKRNHHAK